MLLLCRQTSRTCLFKRAAMKYGVCLFCLSGGLMLPTYPLNYIWGFLGGEVRRWRGEGCKKEEGIKRRRVGGKREQKVGRGGGEMGEGQGCMCACTARVCSAAVPESMRACLRAAHSSMRSLGMPSATALAMPPISSISLINYRRGDQIN